MTDERWSRELERLTRRLERIKAMLHGSADVEVIQVREVWVRRHRRGEHSRVIIRMRKRRAA